MTTTIPTAAETLLSNSADAAHAFLAISRGPQRPAPAPGEPDEAGLGVTLVRTRTGCAYPHPTDSRCVGCEPPQPQTSRRIAEPVGELSITADHEVHPYLIQIRRGHRLLAYAIRDAYGWAITAKSHRRTRTVARASQRWGVEAALLQYAAYGYVPGGLERPR